MECCFEVMYLYVGSGCRIRNYLYCYYYVFVCFVLFCECVCVFFWLKSSFASRVCIEKLIVGIPRTRG